MAILTMGRENPFSEAPERLEMRRAMKLEKRNCGVALWRPAKILHLFLVMVGLAAMPLVSMAGAEPPIKVGAERIEAYLPLLKDKRVAVVTNQTGRIGEVHLVDSLLSMGVGIVKVFAPEHGFRGMASAGEHVKDEKDQRTGLPLVSLYGNNKKPTQQQLADVDVLLFDIQDVGVRFYTYISTLHYVMEAAAEHDREVVVLDRPNPNGFYVDGPVLKKSHSSFVGMHPVPLVHGMTVGEYALMINGEGWLKNGLQCRLHVIPCEGYDHSLTYDLPVRPSPNLPNSSSVFLYPSLGLFEGTIVSVGRGTDQPFQCIGYPDCPVGNFTFTPKPMPGAMDPPYKGMECTGLDLREYGEIQSRMDRRIRLNWLIGLYRESGKGKAFFNSFFDKLAGGTDLRERIMAGEEEETIRASWRTELMDFMKIRRKYLLYDDL